MAGTATVFLRGVDAGAVRLAKVEAARRGETLGRVVGEALRRALGSETDRDREGDEADALAEDMAWFEAKRAALFRKYPAEYVAIVGRRVVDHGREYDALSRRVFARYGVRAVFMPRLTRAPEVVHLRSPRVVRGG